MKQKSFYSLLLVSVMTLAAVLSSGCTEDLSVGITEKSIVIDVSYLDFDGDSPSCRTRGKDYQTISGSILTSPNGKRLNMGVVETAWPEEKMNSKTRGTKISTAGVNPFGVSASVCGSSDSYTSVGCGSYFYNIEAATGIALPYYWPTSSYKLSTFAYYPYGNAAFTLHSSASSTGAPTYAYTVPSAISSQQDIMTGQDVNHLGGGTSPVSMTMKHRCASVNFSVTNSRSKAITVNSVSIEGVKYSGTLNEDSWSLNAAVNSSSSNPFILTPNTSVAPGNTANITGTSNVFLMLPQIIPAGARLKIMVDGEEFEGSLTGEWLAGKNYVYSITMNETWEYILNVSGPSAYSYAGGTNTYTIQSYRSKSEGLVSENIAWTATYDTNGDGIYNDTKPAWLTVFTASGSGSTSATAYNATLSAQNAVIGTASDTYAARSCSVKITQSDSGEARTFTVTQNAFTDTYTYYLTVTGPTNYTYAGGTKSYSVTSYKQNTARTTAVAWTATYSTDSGSSYSSTKPSWITAFTGTASGGSSALSYNATVAAQTSTQTSTADTYAARSCRVKISQNEGSLNRTFDINQVANTVNYTDPDPVSVGDWTAQ